jgi:Carboxypeptidase regulatory-like domain
MVRGVVSGFLALVAALVVLLPTSAYAQEGQITGTVRDAQMAVMPGVTVEVTSPALIEKVRSTSTDGVGAYRITNLPVGTYKVTFSLAGFNKQERDDIVLTSGFTAAVNGTMTVGQLTETIVVAGVTPTVDVQNSREVITLPGDRIKDMPTSRNVNSLLELTPGISSQYTTSTAQSPFGAPGVCVGGIGVFCNPGISGFNIGDRGTALDQSNMAQGRVLVDGVVVNSGGSPPIGGSTGGYTADVANSQEVNIRVSGSLGESENGASEINIVPRTGGNRFAGDFFLSYTTENWFGSNYSAYPNITSVFQPVKADHDWSVDYGGPVLKDKLWFFALGRSQYIHKLPVGVDWWPNLWEGKAGYNYQPDRSQPRVEYENMWKNGSGRVTFQASAKNKFNVYWDEQSFCQDPCTGVVSVFTSPESWVSIQTHPDRLQQLTWTNPLNNKILLEAGVSLETQYYNASQSRNYTDYVNIPRISEIGPGTFGLDATGAPPNVFAGSNGIFAATSGSITGIPGGLFETRDQHYWRTRGSIAYVSGSHHAKFGYDGGYYKQLETNAVNSSLLTYNYVAPAATAVCVASTNPAVNPCGNLLTAQFPTDPFNFTKRPIPSTVNYTDGQTTFDEGVRYDALYAQDQWTLKRLTLGAALRFDHATSHYGSSCFGPNQFVPTAFCTSASDGVNYKDLTPRVAVAWDVQGNGKTAVKFSFGKFNNAAAIGTGFYSAANPARRVTNQLQRPWTDTNADRKVDCDLNNSNPNGECGALQFGFNDVAHFGKDPGTNGLTTVQCGRNDPGIDPRAIAYCNQYGQNVLSGWNERRGEWQFDLGVQREILPRLTGEFVYHRRVYTNISLSDGLTIGCDRFGGATDFGTCNQALLNYSNPSYDFFNVAAPVDPKLPGGGGYTVTGLYDVHAFAVAPVTVQTYSNDWKYVWNGFDTNWNWRGPRGIFVQAGTSTSRINRNTCSALADLSNANNSLSSLVGHSDAPYQSGCLNFGPFQTNVRGSAVYTVPKVDVLVSAVFQSLPGTELTAVETISKSQAIWANSARATAPCALPSNGVGCFLSSNTFAATTWSVPLLLNNQMFGDRINEWDMKIAKNIRFKGKRLNVGVDVYNIFNSDGITQFNTTYTATPDGKGPAANNAWGQPLSLISPRYVRLQIQANF